PLDDEVRHPPEAAVAELRVERPGRGVLLEHVEHHLTATPGSRPRVGDREKPLGVPPATERGVDEDGRDVPDAPREREERPGGQAASVVEHQELERGPTDEAEEPEGEARTRSEETSQDPLEDRPVPAEELVFRRKVPGEEREDLRNVVASDRSQHPRSSSSTA